MSKRQYKIAAFVIAGAALLIISWRHGDAALAIAAGALAIIGSTIGLPL